MENVYGLVRGKMKLVFAEIMKELKASGYKVQARLLDAKYFNVPQQRLRIIVIGVRNDLNTNPIFPNNLSVPIPLKKAFDSVLPKCEQKALELPGNLQDLIKRTPPGGIMSNYWPINRHYSSAKVKWEIPSRTILKTVGRYNTLFGGGLFHPDEYRRLNIGEVARIGSFPDQFQFTGTYEQQWGIIGNSVPPLMMEAIARTIKEKVLKV